MLALDLMIVIPLLLAVLAPLSSKVSAAAPRWIGLLGSLSQLALLLSLGASGLWTGERLVAESSRAMGGLWSLATDGLSTPLVLLTAVVGCLAVAASWRVKERPGAHFGLLLLLQAAVAAVFLADNLVLFYIAWESVLVPMFFLIAGWGSKDARRAAMKFLVYTFAGGALMLAGIIYVSVATEAVTFSGVAASSGRVNFPALAFWLMAAGFLVKLPAVGLHTWLPDAHTEAPTAGSIVLAGVLLKMGGYGLIRLGMVLVPVGFAGARPALAGLGIAGVVLGAAFALVQTDLKRLVAYSSVAHMGFVLLAISVATPTALAGALAGMISHGLVAPALFFLVGSLYERTHTRELSQLGGLGAVTPRWATGLVFFSLASAGLPGLSGFPGEFVAIAESFPEWGWWVAAVGVGVVLSAAYNLRAIRTTVQGRVGEFGELADLGGRETVVSALLAIAVVVLGLAPWLITGPASPILAQIARGLLGGK